MRLTLSRSSKISRWGIFAESRKFQILLWACGWITIAPSIQPAQGQECSSQPVAVGYRDFNYGSQVYQAPTAEKPEHKLWWNDGLWWGSLWDSNSNRYRIHRFNVASQCWTNVGPDIDDRSLTLADVLWDGQHLYVVSHIFMTGSNGPGRLYRYSYNTISQSYSLDAGFPVNVNNENSETLSLAKDSEGQLWVTWQADDMVMVNRTLGNDLTWGTPFQLAVQGNDMNSDDISSIIAFGGNKVGIMWGNQEDEAMYFAVHLDADPDATWQPRETALSDANLLFADDHINLKSTIDGAVYAATKTGVDNSNDPNIYLLKRGANGIWSKYLVGTKAQNHSRPILLIDEQNRNIYVFMPALDEVPRPIYMKSSDLDNIQFPAGFGTVFIESASDELINNPTSTRQNVNGTTGILVLASDEGTRNYFHNYMSLNGGSQPPPTAPSNLTASAINNNQIDLSWADNSNDEDGFRIERKKEGETSFTEIATVGANATSYSSTGLLGNLVYFYRVRAHSDADFSAYSNEDSALTLMKGPANLVATAVSSSQINLTWSDQTSNETGFSIERKIGAAGSYAQVGTAGANATNFPDNGLTTGTQYFYRIRAHNATNVSAYSNEANATTFSGQPTTPDSLSATAVSNLQINLAWKDKSSNEDGFKIERKQGALGTYAEIAAVGPNVTSYVNATGLSGNTKYFYRVRAYSAAGNSAYCNEANATTLLKASTNLVATPVSSSQIDLTWTDQTTNESGFKIERKTGVAGTYAEIATVGVNVTSYSNTGLTTGTQYFYRIRAHNATNVSAYSNEANATTFSGQPTTPDSLSATAVSNLQINLAWKDKSSNEDGFKIERKQGALGTYAEIAAVGPNVTSYVNATGLSGNAKYFYRVRAYNAAGNSAYCNEANATTLLKASTNLVATPVSSSQIDLTWTDQTTNESGFKIERKTGVAGTYAEIAAVGVNVTNYSNTGLATGTQYFYRIRAYNSSNVSTYSNEANATTSGPAKSGNAENQDDAAIPEGITLAPNYPNPFNPSTTIAYTLSEGMQVKLTVINVRGQVVAVLVNGYQGAGRYQKIFKAADLPSGVYYAVLRSGAVTKTQRMLLAK